MRPLSALATRRFARVASLLSVAVAAACGSDNPTEITPQPPKGIIVLDGFIQPGFTFVGDTGTATTKVALGSPTEFDAGGFVLLRDTLLAVSSRGAGDLLYITDVNSSVVKRVQLPSKSNPSKARLLTGTGGQTLIAAALRDSQAIALVSIASGNATITRIANAGTCPTDMFRYGTDTWIVDANANCKVNYALQGDVRLIRVPATGTTRDTLVLTGMRGSGAGAIVMGDVAYISAGGDASFASFPYTLLNSGSITKVDLKNRRVVQTKSMPTGSYGASMKLGLDGFLYVSLYENLSAFAGRVIKMRADDLSFVSNSTTPWLSLTNSTGTAINCGSAQADALGRVHCIANGTGSVTSLIVFNTSFVEARRVTAGQGGVDMALR